MYNILININSYQTILKVYGMTFTLPRPLPQITFRKITGHEMLSIQGLRKVLSWHQANLICTLHHIHLVCSCSGSFVVRHGYKDV